MSQSTNLTETLGEVLRLASTILEADAYALWLFVSAEMEWKCEITSNLSPRYRQMSAEKYLNSAFLAEQHKSEEMAVIPDINTIPELLPLKDAEGVEGLICIPLNVSNQRSAAAVFFYRRKHKLKRNEIQFCRILRNTISSSLGMVHSLNSERLLRHEVEKMLASKDALLREGTYRLKNTLQTVSSLLSLQSKEMQDENAKEAFQKSIGRIQTMILIHEKFHENSGRKMMSMDKFMYDLTRAIFDRFSPLTRGVNLKVESDRWGLDPDLIVPLGLLLNELISNSLKHAFGEDTDGTISVSLRVLTGGKFELTYSDDGTGLPEQVSEKSFGLRLIALLADQLGANTMRINVVQGTAYRFVFAPRKNHRDASVFA